ncbi:MAG: hypothetical protein HC836_33730 [Richelia sp. RM2_1_2]|nr:hypothetical protein [Richelia sp. SM1_7_0]NJN10462.1 hypothetical protein [Richelia sp. RM1_1_1]NJO63002.1 hypothetical protein [Richelia sp. RM2_1_2]
MSKYCTKPASIPLLKPEKSKLTAEELAEKLGVSTDNLLSEVKKCHKSFNKWSATHGKGRWNFEIETSKDKKSILKFQKVD